MAQPGVDELLALLGEQLKAERIRQRFDQAALAAHAGVERKTISRLENGGGGNLHTLVAVVRALGKIDWLRGLAPAVQVDPMQLLRSQRTAQRVKRSKEERGNES